MVESILQKAGFELTPVANAHLCCGSAGTYSILQPALAQQLLANKLEHLQTNQPQVIASANIGCQMHLASEAKTPVVHWIELLDQALADPILN
jgi:glycolate oxidase iron-sulfur subunit